MSINKNIFGSLSVDNSINRIQTYISLRNNAEKMNVLAYKTHHYYGHSDSAAGQGISKSNKQGKGFFHPPISQQISSKSAPIIRRLQGTMRGRVASMDPLSSSSERFAHKAADEGAISLLFSFLCFTYIFC